MLQNIYPSWVGPWGHPSTRLQGITSFQDFGEVGWCFGMSRAADVTEVHRGPPWSFWAGRQLEGRGQHGSPMAGESQVRVGVVPRSTSMQLLSMSNSE